MTGILFDRTTGVWAIFAGPSEDQRLADQPGAGCAIQPDQALQILEQALRRSITAQETQPAETWNATRVEGH